MKNPAVSVLICYVSCSFNISIHAVSAPRKFEFLNQTKSVHSAIFFEIASRCGNEFSFRNVERTYGVNCELRFSIKYILPSKT